MERYEWIKQQTDNPYLNLYQIHARTRNGDTFDYYFASRNDCEHLKHKTNSTSPEGMAIYAIHKDFPDKIVLIRQYRYPLNAYIYELPAGLIEAGETAAQAAVREMKEETGLSLEVYEGGKDYYRRPFFLAQGITDESGIMVYGTVAGEPSEINQEDTEDIEVVFANKEEVRRILSEERVSVRAAFHLMLFLQSDQGRPFAFLNN